MADTSPVMFSRIWPTGVPSTNFTGRRRILSDMRMRMAQV